MKKLLVATIICVLISIGCQKEKFSSIPEIQKPDPSAMGQQQHARDIALEYPPDMRAATMRKIKGCFANLKVLFVEFDGATVANTSWNFSSAVITCAASGLSSTVRNQIMAEVRDDYFPFNVEVTDDRKRYDATPLGERQMCIVTPWSADIYPAKAGGVAYIGSIGWGDPCFVFSDLLGNKPKNIGDATSHEFGHATAFLQHDVLLDDNCNYIQEYRTFSGSGPLSYAGLMGYAYPQAVTIWDPVAYNRYSCPGTVNEFNAIASYLGTRNDHVGNTLLHPMVVRKYGAINEGLEDSADVDVYLIDDSKCYASVISGGNIDIQVVVQDMFGRKLAQWDNAADLNVDKHLVPASRLPRYLILKHSDSHAIPRSGGSYQLKLERS